MDVAIFVIFSMIAMGLIITVPVWLDLDKNEKLSCFGILVFSILLVVYTASTSSEYSEKYSTYSTTQLFKKDNIIYYINDGKIVQLPDSQQFTDINTTDMQIRKLKGGWYGCIYFTEGGSTKLVKKREVSPSPE
jgi:hypothetical protein